MMTNPRPTSRKPIITAARRTWLPVDITNGTNTRSTPVPAWSLATDITWYDLLVRGYPTYKNTSEYHKDTTRPKILSRSKRSSRCRPYGHDGRKWYCFRHCCDLHYECGFCPHPNVCVLHTYKYVESDVYCHCAKRSAIDSSRHCYSDPIWVSNV